MDYKYFRSIARIAFIFLAALAVFFFAAFIVVSISPRENDTYQIPDLVYKYYIDVHNDLMAADIKTDIDLVEVPDQPRGIILGQSILPGKFVEKKKTKITLTVNQAITRVKVPELVDQTLQYAQNTLQSIPVGENYVSLKIGTLTYIGGAAEKNIIISQWPPGGQIVNLEHKVNLLISGSPPGKTAGKLTLGKLKGMNAAFAMRYLQKNWPKLSVRFIPNRDPEKISEENPISNTAWLKNGKILKQSLPKEFNDVQKAAVLELTVAFAPRSHRFRWGVEYMPFEVDDDGSYTFRVKTKEYGEQLIAKGDFKEDEIVHLFFNRAKKANLRVYRNNEEYDTFSFEPEDLN